MQGTAVRVCEKGARAAQGGSAKGGDEASSLRSGPWRGRAARGGRVPPPTAAAERFPAPTRVSVILVHQIGVLLLAPVALNVLHAHGRERRAGERACCQLGCKAATCAEQARAGTGLREAGRAGGGPMHCLLFVPAFPCAQPASSARTFRGMAPLDRAPPTFSMDSRMAYLTARWQISVMSAPEKPWVTCTWAHREAATTRVTSAMQTQRWQQQTAAAAGHAAAAAAAAAAALQQALAFERRSRSTSGATGDLRSADLKMARREPSSAGARGGGGGGGGGAWFDEAGRACSRQLWRGGVAAQITPT